MSCDRAKHELARVERMVVLDHLLATCLQRACRVLSTVDVIDKKCSNVQHCSIDEHMQGIGVGGCCRLCRVSALFGTWQSNDRSFSQLHHSTAADPTRDTPATAGFVSFPICWARFTYLRLSDGRLSSNIFGAAEHLNMISGCKAVSPAPP